MSNTIGFDPDKFIEENKDNVPKDAGSFDPDLFIQKNTEPPLSDEEYEAYKPNVGTEVPLLGVLPEYAGAATGALFSDKPFGEAFSEEMDKYQRARQMSFQKEPVKAVSKSIAGGAMLPLGKYAKIPEGAGKMAQILAYLTRGGKRALETGAITGTDTLARTGDKDKAIESGITGAKFGFGGEMIEPVAKGVGAFGRRFVAGVKPQTAAKYKARPEAINAIDEDQLLARADDDINKLQRSGQEAKELASDTKDLYREKISDLKRTEIPEDVPDQIIDNIKKLRKEVSKKSGEAFEVLHRAGKTVPVEYIKRVFKNRLRTMQIGGAIPDTSESRVLKKYLDYISEISKDELTYPELKKFIQILDDDVEEAFSKLAMPGGRLNSGDKAIISSRSAINELLYDIPEYKAIMEPLAKKTELLKNVRDLMASEKKAYKVLRGLDKPENKAERALVQRLDDETGSNVIEGIKEYETAKNVYKDPNLRKQLPEYEAMTRAGEAYDKTKRAIDEVGLSRATIQGAIRKAGRPEAMNRETIRKLRELSKYSDIDFVQAADDLGIKRALEQGFVRGSRNVNLGAFSFGGFAGFILKNNPEAAAAAAGLGSIIGAAADIVGPQTWKKFVDISMTPQGQKVLEGLSKAVAKGSRQAAIYVNTMAKQYKPTEEDYSKRAEQ